MKTINEPGNDSGYQALTYKTYIEGFDEMLGAGIPQHHIVMVSGTSGAMKSSIAYAFLYNNALQNGTRSLYVSLEQNRRSLLKQMDGMGFSTPQAKDLVDIIDLGILRRKMAIENNKIWIDLFKMYIEKAKVSLGYELLVIDSMEVLEMLAKFKNYRLELFNLFRWLKSLSLTVILIAEIPQVYAMAFQDLEDMDIFSRHKEGYLVDGVIHLKMEKRGDFEVERRIRIVKMRGARHSTDLGLLTFENHKFQVIPIITS